MSPIAKELCLCNSIVQAKYHQPSSHCVCNHADIWNEKREVIVHGMDIPDRPQKPLDSLPIYKHKQLAFTIYCVLL